MGHIRSSGPTLNNNSNDTSSFSCVWKAASLRTVVSELGQRVEAYIGIGEGGYSDGTRVHGGYVITSTGDNKNAQINRQIEDVWGRID
jgi:hypothetical protein